WEGRRRTPWSGVFRPPGVERQVHLEDDGPAVADAADLLGDNTTNDCCGDIVEIEDPHNRLDFFRPDREHHPLLALGNPNLPRSESFLLQRHLLEVHLRAEAAREGHLADDAGQAAAPEVLEAVEEPGLCRLDTRVDQRFL